MKVTYDAQVCIHAGNCVKSLPAVFKVVDGQFVIRGYLNLSFLGLWRRGTQGLTTLPP
jgi:hypothetical protein